MKVEVEIPDRLLAGPDNDEHKKQLIKGCLQSTVQYLLSTPPEREDELTGLWSGRKLSDDLWDAMYGSRDLGEPFVARYLALNVHRMHEYNQTHGPEQGNTHLQDIAHRLRSMFPDARIYRVGGDEFLIDADDRSIARPVLPGGAKLRSCEVTFKISKLGSLTRREPTWNKVRSLIQRALDVEPTLEGAVIQHAWDATD